MIPSRGSMSCGGSWSEDPGGGYPARPPGPLRWWAKIRFNCARCGRKHRVMLQGEGDLPYIFKAKCPRTGGEVVIKCWNREAPAENK
jgi:hypothetical protein